MPAILHAKARQLNHQNHQTPRQREIFGRRFGSLLLLLELAANHGESEVADLLGACLRAGEVPRPEFIKASLKIERPAPTALTPFVPDLKTYDSLLTEVSA